MYLCGNAFRLFQIMLEGRRLPKGRRLRPFHKDVMCRC